MHSRSEIKAGAVIVIAMALTAIVTVAAGRFGEFTKKKQTIQVLFTDVQGLKVDDPVQVMGLERGKVLSIDVASFTDVTGAVIPAVRVTAKVVYPEPFAEDTKITIDRTLTGNTVLKVEPGRDKVKIADGKDIMGLGAISITELANKAGVMAKRLDDFLADITDRSISASIKATMMNLKGISEDAKTVTASLSHSIPGIEKSLVSGVSNLDNISASLKYAISGNKEKISDTISNVHAVSKSVVNITGNVDRIVDKNQDKIESMLVNLEKSSSNLKTLTREVRWQPWVLLNKPDEVEIRERSVYNSALEFSEGAENLNATVKHLVKLIAAESRSDTPLSKEREEELKRLMAQIRENLDKSAALERKIWSTLHDKSK